VRARGHRESVGGIVTHPERDLFHASVPEIVGAAAGAGGEAPVWIGE